VAFELVERDDGFLTAVDAARYFAGPEQWFDVERWAVDQAAGRVLDVGCGGGRHAVAATSAGCEVVGVDVSAGAVAVARQRGVRAVRASVLEADAGLGTFDTFVLLGNNIGLLGGPEQAPEVLRRLAALARPGARLLGSGVDAYATDAPEHRAYHAWNRSRGRAGSQVRVRIRDRMLATDWFDYWFPPVWELAVAVAGSSWRLAEVRDGGSDGGPGRYGVRLDLVPGQDPGASAS
jgi:SAM-dependent methyltransferase